ncbi:MAG: SprT-like domain-containing protein [Gammaproteobacteria bacterium]|nr:SprT-like domain-containing protein [Gammaproteobacteria bacterium]MCY3688489.1 SprT-like domain-containing protein [Gammaproteobacteria bacterium]MYF00753.1 SprT family zinc-dependent metalloprotease [Gammaproteobacteria bacterium]MYG96604.1 SprT family zinc-dependent metalloprotease [Gammaproteobacteria bacterium]
MHNADKQILFDAGDEVWFSVAGKGRLRGSVQKLNPTRAKVHCGAEFWNVPYGGLNHVCKLKAEERKKRIVRLMEVTVQARELMDRHGLTDWSFRFNNAERKLGVCRYREKRILLSRGHAANGARDQVTDTILHEIAHALAGPRAGHGSDWKTVARQLGATPKSCAPETEQTRDNREIAKAKFKNGDPVSFKIRGETRLGVVERMNPKRAKVRCLDTTWSVPYAILELRGSP